MKKLNFRVTKMTKQMDSNSESSASSKKLPSILYQYRMLYKGSLVPKVLVKFLDIKFKKDEHISFWCF